MGQGPAAKEEGAQQAQGRGKRGDEAIASNYNVLGIEHVHITAPEELIPDVADWYRDCLGLDELEKPAGSGPKEAWFSIGTQELHISIDEHNPPKTAHFALVVDDYEPVIETLREAGCHIEQAPVIPGRHRFYTRDPAGNRVEVVHYDESPRVASIEEARGERRARVLHEEK